MFKINLSKFQINLYDQNLAIHVQNQAIHVKHQLFVCIFPTLEITFIHVRCRPAQANHNEMGLIFPKQVLMAVLYGLQ